MDKLSMIRRLNQIIQGWCNGIPEFEMAAAEYLKKVYGLNGIDPLKHIVHGIGSKPILAMLPLCFINPGDVHLTTTPGYPVMATHTKYLGGIQKAAIKALNSIDITQKTIEKYSRRFDLLVPALEEIGFKAKKPKGSFYCYVKAPAGTEDGLVFKTATDFSTFLIRSALISTVPWDDVGEYIRFSVTFSAETIVEEKKIIDEMKRRMKKLRLVF
jgi:aspartate/methionine/tyrosine aminotransferase